MVRLPPRSMAANVTIVAGAFAVSRVLGMVRESVIAARFGTSSTYDAYVAAFRIPDLLFFLVISGAFGFAFIPVFGGFLARGETERAWRLANTLMTYVAMTFLIAAALILVFAGPLIRQVIAPELPPDSQQLAISLTRLLLLSPLLLGFGAAAKGMLEAHDAVTLPAIAPVLYNLGIIFGALLLTPFFDIYGLAIGVIIGAAGQVAVQLAALLRLGLRIRPGLSRQTEGLTEVARLLGPRIAGQAASQANLIVMTNVASRLGEGSISALSYANSLVLLPHGILAMSLATVLFPRLARHHELGQLNAIKQTLNRVLGPLLFLTFPAAIGLVAFRVSIVQMLFQYGSFSALSTALVAEAVGYFALGLVARAMIEPITRTYYAMRDSRTPLIFALAAILANVALGWPLASWLGPGGLALSLSITYTLRMAAMLAILSRRTGGLTTGLVRTLPRILLATAVLGIVAVAGSEPLARLTDPAAGRGFWTYGTFVLALAGAGALYLLIARALRVPELDRLLGMVWRRVAAGRS